MAPCEPRFLLESTGEDSNPMMKTILQKIRVELAILGEKKKIDHPHGFNAGRFTHGCHKALRCVKTHRYRLLL